MQIPYKIYNFKTKNAMYKALEKLNNNIFYLL